MAQFNIIHLSDLHIINEDIVRNPENGEVIKRAEKNYEIDDSFRVLHNLVSDIEERIKNMYNIILIVTGDVVNMGNIGNINSNKNPTLQFFKQLFEKCVYEKDGQQISRLIDVQICPGNHDKDIFCEKELALNLQQQSPDVYGKDRNGEWHDELGTEAEWIKMKPAFNNFKTLVNKIYDIFNEVCTKNCDGINKKENIDDSRGVEFIKIRSKYFTSNETQNESKLDLILGFVRLNTAFIAAGEHEEVERRRLLVGGEQRESLMEEYKVGRNKILAEGEGITKNDFVTFCLSHYPLDFLKHLDKERLKKALLDEGGFNAEFFFFGHTHERETISFSKKGKTVTCFETGLGLHNSNEDRGNEDHSYSIYTFNREKNIYSTTRLRSDAAANIFLPDFGFYGSEKLTKIVNPWLLKDLPFIKPKSYNAEGTISEFFVDSDALIALQKMSENHLVFKEQLLKKLQNLLLNKITNSLEVLKNAKIRPTDNSKKEETSLETKIKATFNGTPFRGDSDVIESAKSAMFELISAFVNNPRIYTTQGDKVDRAIFCESIDDLYTYNVMRNGWYKENIDFEECVCTQICEKFQQCRKYPICHECQKRQVCQKQQQCKSTGVYEYCYKCKDFLLYLRNIANMFIKCFGENFKDDEIRVIIRGYDKIKRIEKRVSKGKEIEVKIKESYRPIIEATHNYDEVKTNRAYDWKDWNESERNLIMAIAFADGGIKTAPRIFSLNRDLVNFDVGNWKDFIVITPRGFNYNIENDENIVRPAISIVASIKLTPNEDEGESLSDLKDRYKQLSNKLYLLEHIGIQETIDRVVSRFVNAYQLDAKKFIEYLEFKEAYVLPPNCTKSEGD